MAVRWGTRPDQQVIAGTIGTLAGLIRERGMKPPATIVVGDVVSLRAKLSWFEKLPLFGRKIVVTRARRQAGTLAAELRHLGAEAIELPTIEIRPASDYGPLDRAIGELEKYQWLVFTSVNGVAYFLERLALSAKDPRAIRGRIAAIGPATAEALKHAHLKADVVGEEYVAEGLINALAAYDFAGSRVLIPRAAAARDVLPVELRRRGAAVDVVEAYRTAAPVDLDARAAQVLAGRPDWIAFTSSSTVENLIGAAGADALADVRTASIGPVTSASLRKHGVAVGVEAAVFTVPGLVDAIAAAGIIGS